MNFVEFLNLNQNSFDAPVRVEDQEPFSGEVAQHGIPKFVQIVRVGSMETELGSNRLYQHVDRIDGGPGIGEVRIGKIVKGVFHEDVSLASRVQIDIVSQLTQRGETQVASRIFVKISCDDRIDLSNDRARTQPVHDLIFVSASGSGVRARHSNDERGVQPALHLLGNSDDVVGPSARVAGVTEVVVHASTAQVEFDKFRAVGVPLEHDGLGPIVPERSADDDVLIDEDVKVAVNFAGLRPKIVTIDRGETALVGMAIDSPVFIGKMHIRDIIVGFVNG